MRLLTGPGRRALRVGIGGGGPMKPFKEELMGGVVDSGGGVRGNIACLEEDRGG